jgi:DNA-binding NtrC family response regulator
MIKPMIMNSFRTKVIEKRPVAYSLSEQIPAKISKIIAAKSGAEKENIHQISILAINQLNEKYHQQILGIELAGVEALTAFPWPHNFDQLYSVLDRLVQQSKSDYLNTQLVQSVLTETQTAATPPVAQGTLLDLIAETDLATLNTRIAQEVLQNSNGNQSLTARKLGISRTTLWRMLKR